MVTRFTNNIDSYKACQVLKSICLKLVRDLLLLLFLLGIYEICAEKSKQINKLCFYTYLFIVLGRINQLIYTKTFSFINGLVLAILYLLFLLCQSITALSSYKWLFRLPQKHTLKTEEQSNEVSKYLHSSREEGFLFSSHFPPISISSPY